MAETSTVPKTLLQHIVEHERLIKDNAQPEIIIQCVLNFRQRIPMVESLNERSEAIIELRKLIKTSRSNKAYEHLLQQLLRA